MKISRYILFLALLPLQNGCMDSTITPIKDPPDEGTPQIQVDPSPVDFGIVPDGEQSLFHLWAMPLSIYLR